MITSFIIIGPFCVIAAAMPAKIDKKIVQSSLATWLGKVFTKTFDFHTKLWEKLN